MKRKFEHKGWSYKAIRGRGLGARNVTLWACPEDCGACEYEREQAKQYPWLYR